MSPTKKRRVADYFPKKMTSSLASSIGEHEVKVVIPSPSKMSGQLPTPESSSQVRAEDLGRLFANHKCVELALTFYVDQDESGTYQNGRKKGLAIGVNGGLPIFGGTTKVAKRASSLESGSEEDATPFRSARRAGAASIILSSEEESDIHVAQGPVTPKKRSRTHRVLLTDASAPPAEADTDPPSKQLRQKLSVSPKLQSNADQSSPKSGGSNEGTPKAISDPLVISSGDEEKSSENEIITPARRRRTTANIRVPPQKESSEGEDLQDLDDEVADLSDTSEYLSLQNRNIEHIFKTLWGIDAE